MSKTFMGALTGHPRRLHIEENEHGVNIHVSDPEWRDGYGITIDPSDIPELMLALAEAAGIKDTSTGGLITHDRVAVTNLQIHIEKQERATAEAKEQAELEAEALELANSAVLVVGNPPYPSIEHMSDTSLRKWLAVARKARELEAKRAEK